MTISNFAFNPTDGLRNVTLFPTDPASEGDARNQPQTLLDQIKDKFNTDIIPALNATPTYYAPTGLTGATQTSRYVGATATGAPTTGTFTKGDFVIDQIGLIWVCTTAGTPGTWTKVGSPPNVVTSVSGSYTGDGTNNRLISVGAAPKIVIVAYSDGTYQYQTIGTPENGSGNAFGSYTQASASGPGQTFGAWDGTTGNNYMIPRIRAALNGFLVSFSGTAGVNASGRAYNYWTLC